MFTLTIHLLPSDKPFAAQIREHLAQQYPAATISFTFTAPVLCRGYKPHAKERLHTINAPPSYSLVGNDLLLYEVDLIIEDIVSGRSPGALRNSSTITETIDMQ